MRTSSHRSLSRESWTSLTVRLAVWIHWKTQHTVHDFVIDRRGVENHFWPFTLSMQFTAANDDDIERLVIDVERRMCWILGGSYLKLFAPTLDSWIEYCIRWKHWRRWREGLQRLATKSLPGLSSRAWVEVRSAWKEEWRWLNLIISTITCDSFDATTTNE